MCLQNIWNNYKCYEKKEQIKKTNIGEEENGFFFRLYR